MTSVDCAISACIVSVSLTFTRLFLLINADFRREPRVILGGVHLFKKFSFKEEGKGGSNFWEVTCERGQ